MRFRHATIYLEWKSIQTPCQVYVDLHEVTTKGYKLVIIFSCECGCFTSTICSEVYTVITTHDRLIGDKAGKNSVDSTCVWFYGNSHNRSVVLCRFATL